MLACSDNMFVHNNSKHGRKSRKVESAYGMCGCTALFGYIASQVKGIPNLNYVKHAQSWVTLLRGEIVWPHNVFKIVVDGLSLVQVQC